MANIVDTTFFYGDIPIPQIATTAVSDKVTQLINQREPEFLEAVFTYALYKAYTAGIAVGSPAQKWLDLRDGAEYTDISGYTQKWKGLTRAGDPKRSPIAYFVYYWWLRGQVTKTTSSGESKPDTQNAKPASSYHKQKTAWDQMVIMTKELYWFLYAKQSVYPEWNLSQIYMDKTKSKFFEPLKYGI